MDSGAIVAMATAAQIQEHYDSLALIYRAFWGDHIHHGLFTKGDDEPQEAQIALINYSAGLLDRRGGEHILDVGCGHGGTLLQLAGESACSGIGITLSPKQARIADENTRRAGLQRQISVFVENADHF